MKTHFILLVALAWTTGCTSSHLVDSSQAELWIPKAQEQLLGEDVYVHTSSGEEFSGTLQLLNVDSLRVWDDDDKPSVEIALANVSNVGRSPNIVAPILGGLGGILVGGLIGGALAGLSSEPDVRTLGLNTVAEAANGAVIGAAIGGSAGLIIGGLASKVDRYKIQHTRIHDKTRVK